MFHLQPRQSYWEVINSWRKSVVGGCSPVEKEQVCHGKSKLRAERMYGLHRNARSCWYHGTVILCVMVEQHCTQSIAGSICISLLCPLTSVSTDSTSALAILSKTLSLFLIAALLCGWRTKIHDYLLNLLITLLAKVFLDCALYSLEFIILSCQFRLPSAIRGHSLINCSETLAWEKEDLKTTRNAFSSWDVDWSFCLL